MNSAQEEPLGFPPCSGYHGETLALAAAVAARTSPRRSGAQPGVVPRLLEALHAELALLSRPVGERGIYFPRREGAGNVGILG